MNKEAMVLDSKRHKKDINAKFKNYSDQFVKKIKDVRYSDFKSYWNKYPGEENRR